MRIYWINGFNKGNLGMMARPKGNDWLEDEIKKLKQFDVDTVISLLETDESIELEIDKEEELCGKLEIDFINYPIPDRNVPSDENSFLDLVSIIDQKLKEDKRIVVHCRMGIGRTSVLAAAVLVRNGMESETVFDLLSERRTLAVPDTEQQKKWIKEIENELQQRV